MAEQVIGIRIKLNGIDTVITNISTLEEEIRKAKEDLKELEIGSDLFKELSTEISVAEQKLRGLNDASKADAVKKNFESIIKASAAITATFAAATAAFSLFGDESVAQSEAAAKAQNLLTIAVAANTLATIEYKNVTLGAAISNGLLAASAGVANTTLKGLFATMAANPVGVILVGLGALIGLFSLFKQEEVEVAEAVKTADKALMEQRQSIIASQKTFQIYVGVLNDVNSSVNQQKAAYAELQKIIPSLNGLTLEQARATGILNEAIAEQNQLIELNAELKAYEEIYVEQKKKELAEQQKVNEAKKLELVIELNRKNAQAQRVSSTQQEYETAVKFNEIWYQNQLAAIGIVDAESKLQEIQGKILEIMGKRQQRSEASAAAAKSEEEAAKRLNEILRQRTAIQEEYLRGIQAFTGELLGDKPEILSIGEEIQKQQQEILKNRKELYRSTAQEIANDLRTAFLDVYPSPEKTKILADAFYELFQVKNAENFEQALDELFKTANDGFVQLGDDLKLTRKDFEDLIPKESQQDLDNYLRTLKAFDEAVKKFQAAPPPGTLTQLGLTDISAVNLKLREEAVNLLEQENGLAVERYYTEEKLNALIIEQYKLTDDGTEAGKKATQEFVALIREALINQAEFTIGVSETKEAAAELSKVIKEGVAKQIKDINTIGLEPLKKSIQETIDQFGPDGLTGVFDAVLSNIDKTTNSVEVGLLESTRLAVKNNKNLTAEQLEEYLKVVKQFQGSFEEQVAGSGQVFDTFITDITTRLSEFAKIELLETISDSIQLFNQYLGRVSNLVREYYSTQLTGLEFQYNKTMNAIVGDTEEANRKRIETEKAYQAEKAAIEKKARLASLKFSLAQTTATGAQAIVEASLVAITNPVLGGTLIALETALLAAQLAIINQQIQQVQSMARGGRIRSMASGGALSGPSHEQGGINYFANGGGLQLEGNESVINRASTIRYGDLLSNINQAGGGRPILVNNAYDSRLIEAIAARNTEPIRAYVVEQDITSAQSINKKLEQLASL